MGQIPWGDQLALHDVLVGTRDGVITRFYFDTTSGNLVGVEFFASDNDDDPCEIHFADFRATPAGQVLPHAWHVMYGDRLFTEFAVTEYRLADEETSGGANE